MPDRNSNEFKSAISVEKMQKSDKYTIDNFVPSKELMFRAAMGVYNSFCWDGKSVAIICGSGNNGGDGYALAGILAEKGIYPTLFRTSEKFSADGLYYFEKACALGVNSVLFSGDIDFSGFDVIVDCILGTGFKGTPKETVKTAIERINHSNAFVISVDINSGLNGDTGEAECAVISDLTVSIGYYKTGLFTGKAPEIIKDLVNVDIGIVLAD